MLLLHSSAGGVATTEITSFIEKNSALDVAFLMKSHRSTIKRADTIPLLYQALNPSIHMHHGEPATGFVHE